MYSKCTTAHYDVDNLDLSYLIVIRTSVTRHSPLLNDSVTCSHNVVYIFAQAVTLDSLLKIQARCFCHNKRTKTVSVICFHKPDEYNSKWLTFLPTISAWNERHETCTGFSFFAFVYFYSETSWLQCMLYTDLSGYADAHVLLSLCDGSAHAVLKTTARVGVRLYVFRGRFYEFVANRHRIRSPAYALSHRRNVNQKMYWVPLVPLLSCIYITQNLRHKNCLFSYLFIAIICT